MVSGTDGSKRVPYGELIAGTKFAPALNGNAMRKPQNEWTIPGTPVPRLELPAMVTGQFEYVHNVRVPGMQPDGQVVRAPLWEQQSRASTKILSRECPASSESSPERTSWASCRGEAMAGDSGGEQAERDMGSRRRAPEVLSIPRHLQPDAARDTYTVNSKDVDEKIAAAAKVVKASYRYPYQCTDPSRAPARVADVQGERATIWSQPRRSILSATAPQ